MSTNESAVTTRDTESLEESLHRAGESLWEVQAELEDLISEDGKLTPAAYTQLKHTLSYILTRAYDILNLANENRM